ncbi:hypothetical protein [Sphingomonas jinjuensis]|nr:hypothetical protein [Sphingomonas jinjuensis]
MKHEANMAKPISEMSDEEFDAWISSLPPAPGIPSIDDEEDFNRSIARARADVAAGRVYPHAIVGEWLSTWGDDDFLPFEDWLASRDG